MPQQVGDDAAMAASHKAAMMPQQVGDDAAIIETSFGLTASSME
jgi:hypothetical protein